MFVNHVDSSKDEHMLRLVFAVPKKVHQMITVKTHFVRNTLLLFWNDTEHRHNPVALHLHFFNALLHLGGENLTQNNRLLVIVVH